MKTRSKITGTAISSVPVYLINKGIDFKYDAEKREISTPCIEGLMVDILELCGFTDKMITIKGVK